MKTTVLYGLKKEDGKWESITNISTDIPMVNNLFRTIKEAALNEPEKSKYTDLIQYFSNGRAKIKSLKAPLDTFQVTKVPEQAKVKASDRIEINLKKLMPKIKKLHKEYTERPKIPADERIKKNLEQLKQSKK